jgi:hydroxyethylthiazole kinase-like sugar kinase family protein
MLQAEAQAPGSFQRSLLDALFTIDEEQLKDGARIQGSALGSI